MPKVRGQQHYGQVSATRLTVVTLIPSAPPTPMRIPLTDIRCPANESSRVRTNLSVAVRVPRGRLASAGPTPARSIRSGAVALVKTQSPPLFDKQPTTRTSVFD